MSLKTTCPKCSRALTVREDFVGKTVRCPSCKNTFPVATVGFPAPGTAAPSQEAVKTQSAPPARQDAAPPQTAVGRFRVKAVLGQGGFGTVYRADDPVLQRDVALKVPRFGSEQAGKVERFLREARAAANLRHPNIVPVFEAGTAGRDLYIAAEFVEGQALSTLVHKEKPDPRRAAAWVRDLALALAYAHGEGVVHRDVKPDNILVGAQGRPQLTDFGLARRLEEDATLTTEGTLLGTPAYKAPEQARGDTAAVGPLSDQYSLGVVLYELLTGRTPF
jgi:serine/threonine protein kinase